MKKSPEQKLYDEVRRTTLRLKAALAALYRAETGASSFSGADVDNGVKDAFYHEAIALRETLTKYIDQSVR
jgi:hypothetical protein